MHTAWPAAGFPIRIFPVQSLMTASRDFSQSSTSFIGSICQGIHFVPLSTFLCIDWIGSWIFNSKVGVNLPSILHIGRKRYSLLFKYLHKQIFERDNKHQSHHLTIETQIVKLLCVPHMPSVAWRIRITSITRLMTSRTVVVECTLETSTDPKWHRHLKSLSAFYSTIYYSKLCLICKLSTVWYLPEILPKSLVVNHRYAPHYTIPTWGVWRAPVN